MSRNWSQDTAESEVEVLRRATVELRKEREELHNLLTEVAQNNLLLKSQLNSLTSDVHSLTSDVHSLTGDVHSLLVNMSADVGFRSRTQREGARGCGAQSRKAVRPSLTTAIMQPAHVSELGHCSLAELAMDGNHSAQRERLLREIMCVENCSWEEAHDKLEELDVHKEKFYWFETMPYRIGMAVALGGALGATLLVFWRPLAYFYGTEIAGEELPEGVKDIGDLTTNQVGTWTWSWMEPMIGTASFVLLCCQFMRAHAVRMNLKPYNEYLLQWRADRCAQRFPQYDRSMVRAWAKHMPRVGLSLFPIYERQCGFKGPTSGL